LFWAQKRKTQKEGDTNLSLFKKNNNGKKCGLESETKTGGPGPKTKGKTATDRGRSRLTR